MRYYCGLTIMDSHEKKKEDESFASAFVFVKIDDLV